MFVMILTKIKFRGSSSICTKKLTCFLVSVRTILQTGQATMSVFKDKKHQHNKKS
jgi:hypothetical protein